jgi:3-dehydroquinate dehydratase-2
MARSKQQRSRADTASKGAKRRILVLHGPNLNLLGTREPAVYGRETLADINRRLAAQADAAGVELIAVQSNHEGVLVDRVQAAKAEGVGFIIINPGGFTHTSVALRDSLTGVAIPFVEIHLSNIHAREPFRHHSYFSDKAEGTIIGLGAQGYELALAYVLRRLSAR